MPMFKYKGRDTAGKMVDGILDAENEKKLSEKLTEIGIVLVDSRGVKSSAQPASSFHFGKIKRRHIILFTNHLAISVSSGIPVVQAMGDYAAETEELYFKRIIEDVQRQVLAGTNLSEALSRHPKAFSELYVSIVATGEATGNLELVLNDLVRFMEWQEDLSAHVKQASIYPAFLVSMIIGVVIIMMTVTLPKFLPVLKGFNVKLPAPTLILIGVSEFFQDYWIHLIASIFIFVMVYIVTYRSPQGKYFWDNIKLKMPLLGKLHQKIVLSKFAHYFSILFTSGIGIIESFTIIERVVDNEVIRRAIRRCAEGIEKGETIYESLKKEKTFPPLIQRMIQVGESTGKLDSSLAKASAYYDKEVPAAIKKMFAIFEPMLIVFMGGLVLFIALSVFLPLYKLSTSIGSQR